MPLVLPVMTIVFIALRAPEGEAESKVVLAPPILLELMCGGKPNTTPLLCISTLAPAIKPGYNTFARR
jgi:hypothetical protein